MIRGIMDGKCTFSKVDFFTQTLLKLVFLQMPDGQSKPQKRTGDWQRAPPWCLPEKLAKLSLMLLLRCRMSSLGLFTSGMID